LRILSGSTSDAIATTTSASDSALISAWVRISPRLEIRVMFEELLNRFDHFELDGPLAWMNNNRLAGLTELPVKVFPR